LTFSQQERREMEREDRRADRAWAVLYGPLFWRFVHALDVLGWKIVPQDPERGEVRLFVPMGSKRKHWPSWIEDDRKKPSKLRLIDGDKSDE
jgi:hypothetical protein